MTALDRHISTTSTRVNRTEVLFHDYAGRRYQVFYEVRCWTCNSEHLHEINGLKVLGHSTAKILDGLGLKGQISVRSVDRHFVEHLPGVRSMVNGMRVVMGAAGALDDLVDSLKPEDMLRTIIEIGFSSMLNGDLRPTIAETIQAIKAQRELQRMGEAAVTDAMYAEAITILCEGVRRVMDDDAFSRFMWQIRSQPRMRVILAQLEDRQTDAIPATARDTMVRVPEDLLPSL